MLPVASRLGIVTALALVQSIVYLWLSRAPLRSSRELTWVVLDQRVPFWPWTTWPYLLLLVAEVALPLLVRNRAEFRRMLVAYAAAVGVAVLVQAAWPTHCARPPLLSESAAGFAAYRVLVSLDAPGCAFPSLHVLVPLVAAWSVLRDRGWRWPLAGVLLLVPSVLTTAQHHVPDVLGAAGLAVGGITFATAVLARAKPPAR